MRYYPDLGVIKGGDEQNLQEIGCLFVCLGHKAQRESCDSVVAPGSEQTDKESLAILCGIDFSIPVHLRGD